MQRLDAKAIRGAIRNGSRGDRERMTLPDLDAVDWDNTEVLGWRDPKMPLRGYLVVWDDEQPTGVMLRASEARMNARRAAMCMLCGFVGPADQLSLLVAPRTGDAGRRGDSVGTYVCRDLHCSANLRAEKSSDHLPALAERTAELMRRTVAFVKSV